MEKQTEQLRKVLHDYAVPDPKIVGKLPKGGMTLDFVGHADVNKALIEIDPLWTWQPVAWDDEGMPKIKVANGVATMWGIMTIHGKQMLGVATAQANKPDLYKELASDFIRNAAMRFGIYLSLWTKAEWEDLGATPVKPVAGKPKQETDVMRPAHPDSIKKFIEVCAKENLDHDQVADRAGVNLTGIVTTGDLIKLREAFTTLKGNK